MYKREMEKLSRSVILKFNISLERDQIFPYFRWLLNQNKNLRNQIVQSIYNQIFNR